MGGADFRAAIPRGPLKDGSNIEHVTTYSVEGTGDGWLRRRVAIEAERSFGYAGGES